MYRDTVTVYNRFSGDGGVFWYPTVLRGVNLTLTSGADRDRLGASSADRAVLNVRYRTTDEGELEVLTSECGKLWLPPKVWRAADHETRTGTLTFDPEGDFFCVGDTMVGDADVVGDADFVGVVVRDGEFDPVLGFYGHQRSTRDGVFAISAAAIFSVIPHFEITGR